MSSQMKQWGQNKTWRDYIIKINTVNKNGDKNEQRKNRQENKNNEIITAEAKTKKADKIKLVRKNCSEFTWMVDKDESRMVYRWMSGSNSSQSSRGKRIFITCVAGDSFSFSKHQQLWIFHSYQWVALWRLFKATKMVFCYIPPLVIFLLYFFF